MTYTRRHVVRSHVPETPRDRAVERRNVWSLALPDIFKHLARRSEDTWKSNGAFHFFFFFGQMFGHPLGARCVPEVVWLKFDLLGWAQP